MKITSLKLVNVRNHSSTDLTLDKKINMFIGPNASGKSTIVDAIAFGLTGVNSRTAKTGEGMNEVITFGESRAMVSMTVDGIGKMTRSIPHSFEVMGWEGNTTTQTERLMNELKTTKDVVLCSVYSKSFITMTSNEQKNFMFKLFGVNVTENLVKAEFEDWCKANTVENIADLWNTVSIKYKFSGNPEVFEEIYDDICDERKDLKRSIKQLEANVKGMETKLPEGITVDHRDSTIAKLADLKEQRDLLMTKLGKNQAMERRRKQLQADVELANGIEPIEKTMEQLQADYDESRNVFGNIQNQINTITTNSTKSSHNITKLKAFKCECPVCESVKCPLSKEDVLQIVTQLENEVKIMNDEISTLRTKLSPAQEACLVAKKQLERKIELDKIIPAAEKARTELAEIATTNDDEEQIRKDINILNERLTKGQNILTAIEFEVSRKISQAKAERELEAANVRLGQLETLVSAFGPKGMKSFILNKIIKPLEEHANKNLSILTNGVYSINFRIDEDDFNIYVESDGKERKVEHLSTSERLRIGLIMQDSINELSKLKLLVVDDVETLDINNRKFFFKFINDVKDKYDSIFILATGKDVTKPTADMNVFSLGNIITNGKVFASQKSILKESAETF